MDIVGVYHYGDDYREVRTTLDDWVDQELPPSATIARERVEAWDGTGVLEVGWWSLHRRREHEWTRGRFTGNTICAQCGMLPLDDDDMESECIA